MLYIWQCHHCDETTVRQSPGAPAGVCRQCKATIAKPWGWWLVTNKPISAEQLDALRGAHAGENGEILGTRSTRRALVNRGYATEFYPGGPCFLTAAGQCRAQLEADDDYDPADDAFTEPTPAPSRQPLLFEVDVTPAGVMG